MGACGVAGVGSVVVVVWLLCHEFYGVVASDLLPLPAFVFDMGVCVLDWSVLDGRGWRLPEPDPLLVFHLVPVQYVCQVIHVIFTCLT